MLCDVFGGVGWDIELLEFVIVCCELDGIEVEMVFWNVCV